VFFQKKQKMDLNELLEKNRDRLRKFVALRLDPRIAPRADASDVIQEAFVEAARRYSELQAQPDVPPYVWLRFLVGQKVAQFHQKHLAVAARDPRREVRIDAAVRCPPALSSVMAIQLLDLGVSPSGVAQQHELRHSLESALDAMNPDDREILALRHFEMLDNVEAATVLEISTEAAYKRYVRALKRLKEIMPQP
jgi:RNA polymerase sigma-70 factor (ECF subfamily)